MDLENKALDQYLTMTCDPEDKLLQEIHRETYLQECKPHMLSGHYQGRLLSLLSKMLQADSILEIGTFTGYATLCLAEGLSPEGVIHTIDINRELEEKVQAYFHQSPYGPQIRTHYGEAMQIIPEIEGSFDLVFIDADKKNNLNYFQMLLDRVRTGGLILIDNVLWKGRVLDSKPDRTGTMINAFNQVIANEPRVEKLILPVRDGLYIIRKL